MLIALVLLAASCRREGRLYRWARSEYDPRSRSAPPISGPRKDQAMTIKRHGVGPRLSQAVVHGDTVYLAGMVAADPSADAKGQTQQILKKIDETLAAVGSH